MHTLPAHMHSIPYTATMSVDAEAKGLCAMYQRIVMIPRPDYASRCGEVTHLQLWEGSGAVESIDDVPNI